MFKIIAVTGPTSTIGVALIKQAILQNIKVIAFANKDSQNLNRIPQSSLVKIVPCSLSEMSFFDCEGLHADIFIHLAWGSTNRSVRNDLNPQVDNIKYSLDSVYLAKRLGCHTYIGAGSQAEYGRSFEILNEKSSTNPETAYGIAKLCSGMMTRLECHKLAIRHIWPRIFSTFGPYTQETTILNYTIRCLLHNERPSLTGCEQLWDFLFVDEAARALLLLAQKGKSGEVYCVGSGHSRIMKDYIEELSDVMGKTCTIGYGDLPYGDNTVMHLAVDISKIRNEIGFEPQISFKDGIIKTIDWAKVYFSQNSEV